MAMSATAPAWRILVITVSIGVMRVFTSNFKAYSLALSCVTPGRLISAGELWNLTLRILEPRY